MPPPLQEVDGDDDPLEWERQPEHKQEEDARPGDPQEANGEPGHRRDDKGHGHDGKDDGYARQEQLGHLRLLERLHEVAPLRVRRPC